MSLFQKHKKTLEEAIQAHASREFYSPFPEHPKAYPDHLDEEGKTTFFKKWNQNFEELGQDADGWVGAEISPFLQVGLGISYPAQSVDELIRKSKESQWGKVALEKRAGILMESLFRVEKRYFELAYATMHTTGQGMVMAFQASGPHSNDRALEAITLGYLSCSKYPEKVNWQKPLGKNTLSIQKSYKPVPKGIGLVIGCSTFPSWNSVPGIYSNLITGNSCIVKPHPKAIYPIAVFVSELRNVMREEGVNPDAVLLATDTPQELITKHLAEHKDIKLIDYTGGNAFGEYIESLDKITFTEKSGINNVYIGEVEDLKSVAWNLAFSACLYSGQMCTAPQNMFIPEEGVKSANGVHSYEEVKQALEASINHIITHPKMGVQTIGTIQNDDILKRIQAYSNGRTYWETDAELAHPDYPNARLKAPILIEAESDELEVFGEECFGPCLVLVKVKKGTSAVELIKELSKKKGAITCGVYTKKEDEMLEFEEELNAEGVPVSFNFTDMAFINQHAAFSDFHGTGGNPAGNASFVDEKFVASRIQWIGNRTYVG